MFHLVIIIVVVIGVVVVLFDSTLLDAFPSLDLTRRVVSCRRRRCLKRQLREDTHKVIGRRPCRSSVFDTYTVDLTWTLTRRRLVVVVAVLVPRHCSRR